MGEDLLAAADVAGQFRVSKLTVYRLVRQSDVPVVRAAFACRR